MGDHVHLATLAGDGDITIFDPEALTMGSSENEVLARSTGEAGTVDVSPDGRTVGVMRSGTGDLVGITGHAVGRVDLAVPGAAPVVKGTVRCRPAAA